MRFDRVVRQKLRSAGKVGRRIYLSYREEGPRAAVRVMVSSFWEYTPSGRRSVQNQNAFDEEFGTDTSGVVRISSMDVDSPNYIYGRYYKASRPGVLPHALERLPIRHEEFTFLDYGSGKGLVLLLASDYPFRRIVGVEFARDLHTVALANIRRYRSLKQRCTQIESVCMDVSDFELPSGPLLLYTFDPFEAPVWSRVLANIEAAYRREPRDIFLIYHKAARGSILTHENAVREELFERHHLRRARTEDLYDIYQFIPDSMPVAAS